MPDRNELRLPSIDGLLAFEAAARLGTFDRAADELCLTASAVGKRIAALEDLLGQGLFLRTGKSLALTPAGREYLEQVRAALGLLTTMPQHRRAAQRLQRLRVSTPPTFARQVLVPELEAFTTAHPEIELELVLSIPFLDVAAAEADVEVRAGDPAAAPGARVLLDDVVTPMVAPALLLRRGPLARPADLAGWPLLRTPIEPWQPWFRAAGLDWPEPASGPRFVDLGLTLEAAVAAQGVALGRPSLARHWLAAGSLVAPIALCSRPANRYHVAAVAPTAAAGRFVDWLAATCDRIAAEAAALLPRP